MDDFRERLAAIMELDEHTDELLEHVHFVLAEHMAQPATKA